MVLGEGGRLVAVNQAVERLLGRDLSPRLGRSGGFATVPARGRDKIERLLGCVLSGQAASMGVRVVTVTHQLPSGELRTLLVEYHPVFDDQGRLRFHLMIYRAPDMPDALLDSIYGEPTIGKYAALLEATLGRLALQEQRGQDVSPDPELASRLAALSTRQHEVLEHLLEGGSAKEIARHLNLSVHTVKTHTRSIFEKLGVHSRAELLASFVRWSDGSAPSSPGRSYRS